MKKETSAKELQELILKYLDDPKELYLQTYFNKKQLKSLAIVTTILTIERHKFRDRIIEIRSQMDIPRSSMIQQTKQHLTKLIMELQ